MDRMDRQSDGFHISEQEETDRDRHMGGRKGEEDEKRRSESSSCITVFGETCTQRKKKSCCGVMEVVVFVILQFPSMRSVFGTSHLLLGNTNGDQWCCDVHWQMYITSVCFLFPLFAHIHSDVLTS